VIIVGEIIVGKNNRHFKRNELIAVAWLKVYRWLWLIGIPFAIASIFVSYPIPGENESYRAIGFPLIAAAFDQ
jgi:hypothetical protein